MDQRLSELKAWLATVLPEQSGFLENDWQVETVSGDASFRRYFRAVSGGRSWIAVDAPPDKEDSAPFVQVAEALQAAGVNVPQIYAYDLSLGFMLLGDFGDELFLPKLQPDTVDELYGQAINSLLKIQACNPLNGYVLPLYDQPLLQREVELFREWFLQKLLGLSLDEMDHQLADFLFNYIIDSALEQPSVFVHRDYHSRNLMYLKDQPPGIIDFQDAVKGPITYDLVSLLRDCYINWPEEKVSQWVEEFRLALINQGRQLPDSYYFKRWFDLMGAQRHLKAIGIFSRLNIRDGKPGYLGDIPRTMNYLISVTASVEELKPVAGWLVARVLPAMRESEHFADDVLNHWVME